MYRIKYKDQDDKKIYSVHCKNQDLDLHSHPYFVFIHHLTQPNHSPILQIDSTEIQRFKDVKSLRIPVQSIVLIEEIDDEKTRVQEVKKIPHPAVPSQVQDSCKKNPLP
ncbi:MAG: DUF1820 family protein [Deltaproteobacteria bacterium]|nr:DUF1820 family protein [Deltaproteobacteria bacterium]